MQRGVSLMKKLVSILLCLAVLIFPLQYDCRLGEITGVKAALEDVPSNIPAFPGAEGAGMYTSGGRGGEVYIVTNLEDSGQGSLRDAVSKGNRTVVFAVSGTIKLKSKLVIKGSNLTIAGQTAPGDGICVSNYPVSIEAGNVIVRYMRFRLGDISGTEGDAFSSRDCGNIIIDHCSTSWSIDELCSHYGNVNVTVQWCILSEALTRSSHDKGRHGYASIFGGSPVTFSHNLIAHNTSRNPRFTDKNKEEDLADIEFVNNVIYDWGFKSAYGGSGAVRINMIGNYYKYGPGTSIGARSRILDGVTNEGTWYIADNYVWGYPEVTADNLKGVASVPEGFKMADEPIDFGTEVTIHSAEEAYQLVLENAGAVLPKRDSVDARIVESVKNCTGGYINSQEEVGGWPELKSETAPADTDKDGMPDYWEIQYGLDPNDPKDRNGQMYNDGYTNLEIYLNSIVSNGSASPDVKITSPSENSILSTGTEITINASATDSDGTIEKVEFYAGSKRLGVDTEAPYTCTWKNAPEGTYYITARAIDNTGTSTSSDPVQIHVNTSNDISPWESKDIGNAKIPGSSSLIDGVYTVKGNGKIGNAADSFQYTYQKLEGDGEIIARIDHNTPIEDDAIAAIMIRNDLTPLSPYAMIGMIYTKQDQQTIPNAKAMVFGKRQSNGSNASITNKLGIKSLPYWVKLERRGNTFTGSMSPDGINWTLVDEQVIDMNKEVYIGMAVDSNAGDNVLVKYNTAKFSNVTVNGNIVTDTSSENSIRTVVLVEQSDSITNSASYTVSGATNKKSKVMITVNNKTGKPIDTDDNYKFSSKVSLLPGTNYIDVTAYDSYGSTRTESFKVIYDNSTSIQYEPLYEKIFNKHTGVVMLKFNFTPFTESKSSKRILIKSNTGDTAAIIENTAGGFVYRNSDNSYSTILFDYEKNKTYQFMLQLNIVTQKANVYIDGILCVNQASFYNKASDIARLECESSPVEQGFIVDDIQVLEPDIVVAQDGTGYFTSVQEAIDSIPATNTERVTIYVKKGEYNERVMINKENISLIGEGKDNTKIVYDYPADPEKYRIKGLEYEYNGATVVMLGDGFTADNITFENNYGDGCQALAVYIKADKVVFNNCGFVGNQDTMYAAGSIYCENCYIEGDVDYIYGPALGVFNKCVIYSNRDGFITAPNTDISQPYGFVFLNCLLDCNDETRQYMLGRPWRKNGSTIYKNCYLPPEIAEKGWSGMNGYAVLGARLFEFENVGPGVKTHEDRRQLNSEEGNALTIENICGEWNPRLSVFYTPITQRPVISEDVSFPDIEGHWAEETIKSFAQLGLVSGMPDGNFKPNDTLTNAQIVSMFVRALGIDTENQEAQGNWSEPYIKAAIKAGIVMEGEISDTNRNSPCTRMYAAILAARALKFRNEALPVQSQINKLSSSIKDWSCIKNTEDVGICLGAGIIIGRPSSVEGEYIFAPDGGLTRAEGVAILLRIIDPSKRIRN